MAVRAGISLPTFTATLEIAAMLIVGHETLIWKVHDAVVSSSSVTVTLELNVPVFVGVPPIFPGVSSTLMLTPAGAPVIVYV